MKKVLTLILCGLMAVSMAACSPKETTTEGGAYTPGTYTATAKGYQDTDVVVEVTVDANAITEIKVDESANPAQLTTEGDRADFVAAMVKAGSPEVDNMSGATFTSEAIKAAVKDCLVQAGASGDFGAVEHENVPVTYTAGTYTGTSYGYNGPVEISVTFGEDSIESIEVVSSKETAHVGDVAFPIVIADALEANGSGFDVVSGATFSSKAIKDALNMAAEAAGASDLAGFKSNKVVHAAGEPIEETYDVVVVGAGGAGMGAAAEAAMNGATVIVLEQNAEVGGNTLVSGGQFQATMPYLAWDASNPEATEATWDYDGKTYPKVTAQHGQLDTLKTIANWSEEPFDDHYFDDKEYIPGEINLVSQAGVHAEYLPTLQALKEEINAYVKYADAKIAAGADEKELVLFSTDNLHIFQTYYGGLRQSADHTYWTYGNYELVKQFCEGGYGLKTWLEDQGAKFNDGAAITLIGALWYRENINLGCDMDGDGELDARGNWGTYFVPTMTTIATANEANKIMTRTKADSLIVENGKVVGVNATMYDGTPVTVHATKGVVLATGGFASNIDLVAADNKYWDASYITAQTQTTNRSSLMGTGIVMAEEAGAATTGMDFTQMMPISWIDNGDLAFGNGLYGIYVNPTTGKRFVDESAERDVLSLGEFQNGIAVNGCQGVFMEFTNADTPLTYPYPYDTYEGTTPVVISHDDVENRVYYFSSPEELTEKVLKPFGMKATAEDIYATIEQYDQDILAGVQPTDGVAKHQSTVTVGNVDEAGNYTTDGVLLRVRLMAPSTHHTMGGVVVDTERHVLDTKGNVIEGLFAAGEVTGGIHAGNRLGGNAIVEIFVSGITAADTITK